MDCTDYFCDRHSNVSRAYKLCQERELDLQKASPEQKQEYLNKLYSAISLLHQAISLAQDHLYDIHIMNLPAKADK
jgi:hypothetical protein